MSTRHSSVCCDRLVSDGHRCIAILCDLMTGYNRSVPHMECLILTLDVLLNLAKYAPARAVMASRDTTAPLVTRSLVEQASRFKDASAEAFSRACAVMWTLAHEDAVKQVSRERQVCRISIF